ncbi:GrpB family protein [Mammaliicoccus stepanovicii]|uniref:Dephospho-CoA kinase/protein folding accessory domain-containing protein n=1 Tax=Mammaliicoccus stepanovicii TaxID=643214 RepID=A0A239YA80_9STAP|nr:GrpB family protein [Mammaliicoccus stepanovicii]PNZ77046.1 hypothetical protein CD111_05330 [Mammaliicoccus stepanovicii]GGI43497.1 hypothetical protein GCM10010896_23710 [Mammaliicoccus stepanovicii]SNV55108.1 dephospho-CoA kinase/protein folding accessory domain-containing protein [Mammaliicoccus stepanovicii]
MEINLTNYQTSWVDKYKEECEILNEILGNEVIKFEHFGSTAVEGMKAKPVVDMMVIVKDIEKIDLYNKKFESLGYDVAGEWGIEGRRLLRKGGNRRTHHIHIYEYTNKEIKRHLLVRDYLRINTEEAQKYSEMKASLAEKYNNTYDYSKGKRGYVSELEQRAITYFEGI